MKTTTLLDMTPGNGNHGSHLPPAWRVRLEHHLREEFQDREHPRYQRAADGALVCEICGRLSAGREGPA